VGCNETPLLIMYSLKKDRLRVIGQHELPW
jgi:hypothetical protein